MAMVVPVAFRHQNPAHAGMNPTAFTEISGLSPKPRSRGDEPNGYELMRECPTKTPLTRG